MDYITELEQRKNQQHDGGSGTSDETTAASVAAENQRLLDELAAAHTEHVQMEERIQLLEEREERYAEEIETLTVTLEDMERQKKMDHLDHNHRDRSRLGESNSYENALLPSVKGGGEMVWMDALSEAGKMQIVPSYSCVHSSDFSIIFYC